MKRNINPIILFKFAVLFFILICQLTFLSEVQASGKIVIRKSPGSNVKIQTPKPLGFDSQWVHPKDQKQIDPMKFTAPSNRPILNKVVPENPVEVDDAPRVPVRKGGVEISGYHYVGWVQLAEDAILINVKRGGDKKIHVMLPKPVDFYNNPYPREVFLNGQARRIVVWNGKEDETGEQLLICNDELRSATGQIEAVLSIMPLPGEPLQIKRTEDSFDALQDQLIKKLNFARMINLDGKPWNGRITPYCAQAFEVSDIDDFIAKANAMVFNAYGGEAQLQINPKQLDGMKLLLTKGYRWFAFDVSMLRDWGTITQPIAYRTKSKMVCVPLLDGKIGGANRHSVMRAIIITPCDKKLTLIKTEGLTDDSLAFLGGKSVEFTLEELEKLSPEAAAFCKEHKMDKVLVRRVSVEDKIDAYPCDLKMKNYPTPPAPKNPLVEPAPNPATAQPDANKANPEGKTPSTPAAAQQDGKQVEPKASGNAATANPQKPAAAPQDGKQVDPKATGNAAAANPQKPAAAQPANANPSTNVEKAQTDKAKGK